MTLSSLSYTLLWETATITFTSLLCLDFRFYSHLSLLRGTLFSNLFSDPFTLKGYIQANTEHTSLFLPSLVFLESSTLLLGSYFPYLTCQNTVLL